jgi:hypothetical protein
MIGKARSASGVQMRTISHSDLMTVVNGERKFVIGDLLIYSDFIMCSLENDSTPVFLLHEERLMASNIHEFSPGLSEEPLISCKSKGPVEPDICPVCGHPESTLLASQ